MSAMDKPLVACIAGPTATGKTDAAVAVCRALSGEVISMDSMQIYKQLSIGTAKPSGDEMHGIPHHLLSYVEPSRAYTVAEYQQDAERAMQDVLDRGRLPVFAGGTGLYLQAVSHPLRFTEASFDLALRDSLQARAEAPDGRQGLFDELTRVDPLAAAGMHPNNVRRVIRALEVYHLTGVPMSAQTKEWEAEPAQEWHIFALNWPREMLYDRINRRVDRMIKRGLIDEVRQLLAEGIAPASQAMQAIGYKEVVAMLQGACTLAEAIEQIKMNTRRYAKRQITWLKRDARIQWIDLSTFPSAEAVHAYIIDQIRRAQEERHDT